jgi:hypothetical protein
MAGSASEVIEGKGPQVSGRAPQMAKDNSAAQAGTLQGRFFLARPGTNSRTPEFEREFASEAEAMAEAFKAGVSYYAVIEYRSVVDCSGKQPTFKKEVVKRNS